jgi:hypothetical protein
METYLVKIAGALLLPPASSLLLAALGWAGGGRGSGPCSWPLAGAAWSP